MMKMHNMTVYEKFIVYEQVYETDKELYMIVYEKYKVQYMKSI